MPIESVEQRDARREILHSAKVMQKETLNDQMKLFLAAVVEYLEAEKQAIADEPEDCSRCGFPHSGPCRDC